MLPGVILPSDGLSGLGHFEKGTLCSVCLKGNRLVKCRYSQTGSTLTASLGHINLDQLGSTQIKQFKNKLEKTETFAHLKVKITLKYRPNKERLEHVSLC